MRGDISMFSKIKVDSSWCSELAFFNLASQGYMAIQLDGSVAVFKPGDYEATQQLFSVINIISLELSLLDEQYKLNESQHQAIVSYLIDLDFGDNSRLEKLKSTLDDEHSIITQFESLIQKRSLKGDKEDQTERIFSLMINEENPREYILDIYGENKKATKASPAVISSADSIVELKEEYRTYLKDLTSKQTIAKRSDFTKAISKEEEHEILLDIRDMKNRLTPLLKNNPDILRGSRSGSKTAIAGSVLSMMGCSPSSRRVLKIKGKTIDNLEGEDFDLIEAYYAQYGSFGIVQVEIIGLEDDVYIGYSRNNVEYKIPREKKLNPNQLYDIDIFSAELDIEAA